MSTSKLTLLISLLIVSVTTYAQDSTRLDKVISFPDKFFSFLDKRAKTAEDNLNKQTDKYLTKLQKQERKLKKKLQKKDSALAKQLFPDDLQQKYEQLKNAPAQVSKYTAVYSGHLDSLTTALNFLKDKNFTDLSLNAELQKSLSQYQELQQKLNATDQIKKYLQQRQQLLKDQFEKLGMVQELKKFREQVYYYQAQVKAYKDMFEDPSKLEAKLMEVVTALPQFKDFFAQNSVLGSLFPTPNVNGATASLQGLQTRSIMNASLVNRFGSGANVSQMLQQNVQSAQGQLNDLKNKLASYTSGSYGNSTDDLSMPEGFKPNNQKTKSFLKRLEIGTNFQSQKAQMSFPVTSDLGFSVGYKLNDKSVIGIGASGNIGWGSGWSNIAVTYQGVSLRSFIDWKLKGSIYISGGYEQNYKSQINSIAQLQNYSSWQTSGLVGLTKKYQLSKKLKGQMQLLWDFMSYQQIPRAQPILFRIGYNLK